MFLQFHRELPLVPFTGCFWCPHCNVPLPLTLSPARPQPPPNSITKHSSRFPSHPLLQSVLVCTPVPSCSPETSSGLPLQTGDHSSIVVPPFPLPFRSFLLRGPIQVGVVITIKFESVRTSERTRFSSWVYYSLPDVKILQGTPEESVVHTDSRTGHYAVLLAKTSDDSIANCRRGSKGLCFGRVSR